MSYLKHNPSESDKKRTDSAPIRDFSQQDQLKRSFADQPFQDQVQALTPPRHFPSMVQASTMSTSKGSAREDGKKKGSIPKISGAPGKELIRGIEEGREDPPVTESSESTSEESGTGSTSSNLTLTTSFTSDYEQPNSLTPSPFGSMSPSFEFTDVEWTVSGSTCNVTGKLMCHYPWGVAGGTRLDVPSATDGVVTDEDHASSGKKVWETIVDDLTPSSTSPYKSRRSHFWSESLTARHEQYHGTDDYAWITSTGLPDAQTYIQSQTASSGSTEAEVNRIVETARRQIAQGSDEYYGLPAAHSDREGEIRAYGDGKDLYQSLADAVQERGEALGTETSTPESGN